MNISAENTSKYMLASYTTDGSEYFGAWIKRSAREIGGSLHLAVSEDFGASYKALNSGVGVLFADADYSENAADRIYGDAKALRDLYIFRKDGGFGIIAAREDAAGRADETDGCAALYETADMSEFHFTGYLRLDSAPVYEPMCVKSGDVWEITWSNEPGGARKRAFSKDLLSAEPAGEASGAYESVHINADVKCVAANTIAISEKEYAAIKARLDAPENTGIEPPLPVTVRSGDMPKLPDKVRALYSDGSEQYFGVNWDMPSDMTEKGTYIVEGTVTVRDYPTDFIPNRADPCILRSGGRYYFTSTRDEVGQTVLNIRVSDTIAGIAEAEDHEIFSAGGALIWAPEIHEINGKYMIFFAMGNGWDHVQSHVIVFNGGDICEKENWSAPVRIKKRDGVTNLIEDGITLDMTCFEWESKFYLAWSQRLTYCGNDFTHESANIYIAEYDPSEPGKLAGDALVLTRPLMGWERAIGAVDEGPFTIKHGGRLYMTLAVNSCDASYGIKLLTLKRGGDPAKPEDWIIKQRPLLCTAMNPAEPGPGHSSFSEDENDDPVLVYHWGNVGFGRTTSIKNVHFSSEGEPVLNIPRSMQLREEYKKVTVTVTVI